MKKTVALAFAASVLLLAGCCTAYHGSIEMEIMERCNDDFATVDIATAEQVIKVVMTDTRSLLLRQKLGDLQIDWIT
jgi:protein involved in sex pheromone biosynthesis